MAMTENTLFVTAAILEAQRRDEPIKITLDHLQAARDLEKRQGAKLQIQAFINGHQIELRVAE